MSQEGRGRKPEEHAALPGVASTEKRGNEQRRHASWRKAGIDLEAIQSDYKAALTRADEIMAEGKAVVEGAQALTA